MNNQQLPLTTEEVLIQQVSIDVKVIRIGKKQMTLSVFRQLEENSIINTDTKELEGVAWGKVNYHNNCIAGFTHIHIIWQRENQLWQDTVYFNHTIYELKDLYSPDGIKNAEWRRKAINEYESDQKTDMGKEAYSQHRIRYHQLYKQLVNLDQLFIAV